jgi:hypothetical protein
MRIQITLELEETEDKNAGQIKDRFSGLTELLCASAPSGFSAGRIRRDIEDAKKLFRNCCIARLRQWGRPSLAGRLRNAFQNTKALST